jgi:molecular chaperone GrpE
MLQQLLGRFGVRRIDALGHPFDPSRHEAALQTEDVDHAPGTVVQVLEDGYTIHDCLLRPARVVVARRPDAASPSDGGTPSQSFKADRPAGSS